MPLAHCSADPFTRKEWYDIKAPGMFVNRVAGKTPVSRTTGTSEYKHRLPGGQRRGFCDTFAAPPPHATRRYFCSTA